MRRSTVLSLLPLQLVFPATNGLKKFLRIFVNSIPEHEQVDDEWWNVEVIGRLENQNSWLGDQPIGPWTSLHNDPIGDIKELIGSNVSTDKRHEEEKSEAWC